MAAALNGVYSRARGTRTAFYPLALEQPILGKVALSTPSPPPGKKLSFLRIHVIGVWNSSRHTVQEMTPVLRARSLEWEEMEELVSKEVYSKGKPMAE